MCATTERPACVCVCVNRERATCVCVCVWEERGSGACGGRVEVEDVGRSVEGEVRAALACV